MIPSLNVQILEDQLQTRSIYWLNWDIVSFLSKDFFKSSSLIIDPDVPVLCDPLIDDIATFLTFLNHLE